MSSILRLESSRANGAKSRGPVTAAGKQTSAANAIHATGSVTLELLNRYEVRYSREYHRTLVYFKAHRSKISKQTEPNIG